MNEKGNKAPSIGSEVSNSYLQSFYPTPAKGMKWIYTMLINMQGINLQAELIMEITEIKDDNATIKTSMGDKSFENTVNVNAFAPVPMSEGKKDSTGFRFETNETVKVPLGSIDAVRLVTDSKKGGSFLWLAKDIGPVKFGISYNGVPATLEIKEFIQ